MFEELKERFHGKIFRDAISGHHHLVYSPQLRIGNKLQKISNICIDSIPKIKSLSNSKDQQGIIQQEIQAIQDSSKMKCII